MTPVAASGAPRGVGERALVLALGAALGFSLSRIGFTDGVELHRMFVFADLRMFLVFMGGVALTAAGLLAAGRWKSLPPRPIHRGTIAGGVLFGVGWVVAGACPGVAFVQLGEGKLWALISVAGMLTGSLLAGALVRRLQINRGEACG